MTMRYYICGIKIVIKVGTAQNLNIKDDFPNGKAFLLKDFFFEVVPDELN